MEELHYSDSYQFSHENGFNIAAGLTEFDNETLNILDPTIGELVFNNFSWDENFVSTHTRLESQTCSRKQLSIDGDEDGEAEAQNEGFERAKFFKPHPSSHRYVDTYAKKF